MLEILKKVCNVYGPAGREDAVADVIEEIVRPYVDEIKRDALGNLICRKKGDGTRVMLAAHMDQIGYIVTNIDEKGYLRVHNVGGINPGLARNRHVVFANGTVGALSGEVDGWENSMSKLYIDIGAKDKVDAEQYVALGDIAVSAPDFVELKNGLVSAPAMDNRVGCAVLIGALMQMTDCPNDVTAVFTVQEELGLRGARAAAFDAEPEIAVALDVTLEGDTPKGPKIAVKVGEGPTVKIMDSSLICSPRVVRLLEDAAERAGVAYQREVLTAGGTDAGAIQLSRGGVAAGVISVPCRYVHSPVETVSIHDVEGGAKILAELLSRKI